MRNVVGIAIFVACAGACFACAPAPLAAKFSGDPDAGVSGAAGASRTPARQAAAPRRDRGRRRWGHRRRRDADRGRVPRSRHRHPVGDAGGRAVDQRCPRHRGSEHAPAAPQRRDRPGRDPVHRRVLLRAPGARHLRPLLLRHRPDRDRARQPVCAPAQRHRHHGQRHHHAGRRRPRDDRVGRHHDQRRGAGRGRHRGPVAAQRRRRHRPARRGEQRFIHGAGGAGDVRPLLHVQGRRGGQRHPDEPARADRRAASPSPRRPRRRWTSTSRR